MQPARSRDAGLEEEEGIGENVKGEETHHCDDGCDQEAQEPEAGPMLEGVPVMREQLMH